MPRFNTEAIILKNSNCKDGDRIYTVYSKELGKITAVGKGVRKINSRRSGNLDTLNHVVLGLSEGKGGFKYITEAKLKNSFKSLKDNLESAKSAFYIIELTHRLIEAEEENLEIYELLIKALVLLQSKKVEPAVAVNFFEVRLMKLLGYEMSFDTFVGMNLSSSELAYLEKLALGKIGNGGSEKVRNYIKLYIKNISDQKFKMHDIL